MAPIYLMQFGAGSGSSSYVPFPDFLTCPVSSRNSHMYCFPAILVCFVFPIFLICPVFLRFLIWFGFLFFVSFCDPFASDLQAHLKARTLQWKLRTLVDHLWQGKKTTEQWCLWRLCDTRESCLIARCIGNTLPPWHEADEATKQCLVATWFLNSEAIWIILAQWAFGEIIYQETSN